MRLNNSATGGAAVFFILAVIALVIFWPFVIIWAVNTLFGFGIAYTLPTWFATLVLTAAFGKTSVNVNK